MFSGFSLGPVNVDRAFKGPRQLSSTYPVFIFPVTTIEASSPSKTGFPFNFHATDQPFATCLKMGYLPGNVGKNVGKHDDHPFFFSRDSLCVTWESHLIHRSPGDWLALSGTAEMPFLSNLFLLHGGFPKWGYRATPKSHILNYFDRIFR